jgi:hypothetical protein
MVQSSRTNDALVYFFYFFLCFLGGVVWSRNCRIGIFIGDDEWESEKFVREFPEICSLFIKLYTISSQFIKIANFCLKKEIMGSALFLCTCVLL